MTFKFDYTKRMGGKNIQRFFYAPGKLNYVRKYIYFFSGNDISLQVYSEDQKKKKELRST